mgnify:CR=1 FL=1
MSDLDELRAYEKHSEEKAQELMRKITDKIPLLVAIAIAIWWTLYGSVKADIQTELNWTERITLTIFTIVLALTYCSLIADGGFSSAYKTQQYIKAKEEWNKAVINGNEYKQEITEYANEIARKNLFEVRKESLGTVGLKYDDFFNSDGTLKPYDHKKLTRSQRKIVRRCARIKTISPKLFGDVSGKYFGLVKETTKEKYVAKTTATKAISRIIVSIVSVGITFTFTGFNISSLIYSFFQIVLWSASGVMQRVKNFNFVLENEIPSYETKTLIINGYLNTHKGVVNNGSE